MCTLLGAVLFTCGSFLGLGIGACVTIRAYRKYHQAGASRG